MNCATELLLPLLLTTLLLVTFDDCPVEIGGLKASLEIHLWMQWQTCQDETIYFEQYYEKNYYQG